MYLLLALLGYFTLAVVAVMDKFIVTKEKITPLQFVFYSSAPIMPIFVLLFFGAGFLSTPLDYILALVSGFTFSFALWTMYIAFRHSEVSHVGPLVGAAVPFFVLFLSTLFLGERLTSVQLIAVCALIFGSLLVASEQSREHHGLHMSLLWGVLAGLLFAVSHVIAKYLYDSYGFYSGFVWTRGFIGIFGLLMLNPWMYRKIFIKKVSTPENKTERAHKAREVFLVVVDKVLGVGAVVLLQYATALGSVTLVNALTGAQYGFLILLVACMTRFTPRIFRERYERGELAREGFAVAVIVLGLGLLMY